MREYKLDLNYYTNEPPKPITHEMFNKLIKQRDQYKTERDTLIDDLSWYKAKVSRLERENEKKLALLKEFRKLIDYKLTLHQGSLMYREYRSKLDQLGVK